MHTKHESLKKERKKKKEDGERKERRLLKFTKLNIAVHISVRTAVRTFVVFSLNSALLG